MSDEQQPHKEIKEIDCQYCGERMEYDFHYPNMLEMDNYARESKGKTIEMSTVRYRCPKCDSTVLVLKKKRVQALDDELVDWHKAQPRIMTHIVDTIYDVNPSPFTHYCVRSGYYDDILTIDGDTIYSHSAKTRRCEDCIYFVPTNDLEYAKRHPLDEGVPNGRCDKQFRLRDDCPIYDDGKA